MKKDQDYIVKLEKAIAQKYGKEAIQNPVSNWDEIKEKDYLQQLKDLTDKEKVIESKAEKVQRNGFFVSKKLLIRESNRTCPTCKSYSFSSQDDVYMNKYECCFDCYIKWIENREERWQSGWRPNLSEKEKHKKD